MLYVKLDRNSENRISATGGEFKTDFGGGGGVHYGSLFQFFSSEICQRALCDMGYPSETHLIHKSHEISFGHNLFFNYLVVLKSCTEHGCHWQRKLHETDILISYNSQPPPPRVICNLKLNRIAIWIYIPKSRTTSLHLEPFWSMVDLCVGKAQQYNCK